MKRGEEWAKKSVAVEPRQSSVSVEREGK